MAAATSVRPQDSLRQNPCKQLGLYDVRKIVSPTSAHRGDSLSIGLTILVDCTMEVTRVDASSRGARLTLSVYGTYWSENCPRPLCPAREVNHVIKAPPPRPGPFTVIVRNPQGRRLTKTITIR